MAPVNPPLPRFAWIVKPGRHDNEIIVVIDHDDGVSVTNAPHAVVAFIAGAMGGLGARPVIYRDTTGVYDGLDHDGHRFVGFYPIQTTSEAKALAYVDLPRLV